jgi:molecular chaperone GrpE
VELKIQNEEDLMEENQREDAEQTIYEETNGSTEETSSEQRHAGGDEDTSSSAEQQIAELKDKYLRLMAEFDNFRRRTAKENLEIRKLAAVDTINALLPVLDDFDRAKKVAEKPDSNEVFTEGISLVYNKLYQVLQQQGVKKMESNGMLFDAGIHEAITEIPVPSDDLKGKIVDTVEPGYYLHDKIIRYAKVVVGK